MSPNRPTFTSSFSTPNLSSADVPATRHQRKASASSRSAKVSAGPSQPIIMTADIPTRPFSVRRRRRRASQPLLTSRSTFKLSGDGSDSTDGPAGLYASTSAESSSAEDSDSEAMGWRPSASLSRNSLEYLDLPVSLPYSIVSLRKHMLNYLGQLEERVRNFYSHARTHSTPSSPSSTSLELSIDSLSSSSSISQEKQRMSDGHLAPFYAQLEALKDDLRKLASLLPSASSSFPFPPHSISSAASAAFAARSQSLAQDWERLAASLSFPLPMSSGFQVSLPRLPSASDAAKLRAELPSLPTMPSLPHMDMDLGALFQPLAAHLPSPALGLVNKMQARFEALQESVSAMTLREYVASEHQINAHSIAQRFEATFTELSAKGRARANSVVARAGNAVHEAEDRLYQIALELARNGQALIRYEHLPTVWKNNEHILSGYRFIPIKNWSALLRSTFQIHNETGNIHTHLWGLLAIIPLFWPSKGLDEHTTPMDRLVQTLYLIAAAKCLTLSVSWHVMAGCSDHVWFERFACVDYTGIAWLVAASIWTTVYNGFYCQPNLALFYSCTTLLVGLVGSIVPWADWFNDRNNKPIRIAVFLTMAFTALLPFSHAAFEHGLVKTALFFSPILPSLAFYVGGLVFYALQIPESWAPGKFDLFGHSHQIWHVGIVLAIFFHHQAALTFHANRFQFSCVANSGPMLQSDYTSHAASIWTILANILPSSALWARTTSAIPQAADVIRPLDRVFEKAGGMEGVVGLARADAVVLHWRRLIGTIGNGAVGRGWDAVVDWAQGYW